MNGGSSQLLYGSTEAAQLLCSSQLPRSRRQLDTNFLQLAAAMTQATQLTAHMAPLAGRRWHGGRVGMDGETETTCKFDKKRNLDVIRLNRTKKRKALIRGQKRERQVLGV